MDKQEIIRDIAIGAFDTVCWLSDVEVEPGLMDGVRLYDICSTDYADVIQGIIPAIEEWIEGKELPPTDDYMQLGEDLVLSADPLGFTNQYGDEYEDLADTFPEILVDFWMEDDLVRAEINAVWMRDA